ncbi:hypothetical protein NDU88_007703 [Pleurodeles waltl]|uniref:Uncharacterized protein n=1 Tax=Pleurodeles waltl TaxID=8319 RepID=A0AAV7PQ20_PLEWA|nr:hypothetical protein NDU88_007703 [Pleurodeles waltl]
MAQRSGSEMAEVPSRAVLDRKGPAERCLTGRALFSGASHSGALFSGACHGGALFSGASHGRALFSGACHGGALFSGASHGGALFSGASHGGALFSGACHGGPLFSGACHGGPCSAVLLTAGPCSAVLVKAVPCSAVLLTAGPCSAVLLTAGPVQRCLSCVPREPDLANKSRSVAIRPFACGALLCWSPGPVGVLRHTPNGAGGALLGSSPSAGLVRPAALALLRRISGALASLGGCAR